MAWFRRNRPPARFARTGFAETTLAELAWQRTRTSAHRWGAAGALIGGTAGGMAGRARRSYYTGTPYYAPARSYRGMGYY